MCENLAFFESYNKYIIENELDFFNRMSESNLGVS